MRKYLRKFYGPPSKVTVKALTASCKYSWHSLSRPRLSRITAYLEVKFLSLLKHENLTTGKKILWKKGEIAPSNFSSFPQYFQYISNFKNPITYIFVKCCCSNYFSSILQIWYVEVRISRSISKSPLDFETTRVDCIYRKIYGNIFYSDIGFTCSMSKK